MKHRKLLDLIAAKPSSDGAGVSIHRIAGAPTLLDPFLLLDEIRSEHEEEVAGGFPPHPHRGFETVTYMKIGAFRHEDHMGNRGQVGPGGAQWMTAGSGVIHAEYPETDNGRMHGFQIWLNLPAAEKMKPPDWRDMQRADHPQVRVGDAQVRLIAGQLHDGERTHRGIPEERFTDPYYLDVEFAGPGRAEFRLPEEHHALAYVYQGAVAIGGREIGLRQLGNLSDGEMLQVSCSDAAGFLLLAGRRLEQPVVQYGPFVMNTREQVERAMRDYRDGTLTQRVP